MRRKRASASGDMMKILLHYAAERGINLDAAVTSSGVDAEQLESYGRRISIESLRIVWQELVQ